MTTSQSRQKASAPISILMKPPPKQKPIQLTLNVHQTDWLLTRDCLNSSVFFMIKFMLYFFTLLFWLRRDTTLGQLDKLGMVKFMFVSNIPSLSVTATEK